MPSFRPSLLPDSGQEAGIQAKEACRHRGPAFCRPLTRLGTGSRLPGRDAERERIPTIWRTIQQADSPAPEVLLNLLQYWLIERVGWQDVKELQVMLETLTSIDEPLCYQHVLA